MNVLFCNPPAVGGIPYTREGRCEQRAAAFQHVMVPISLPSAAASVRMAGHQVSVVDCIADRLDTPALLGIVESRRPDLVVFAVTTTTFDADLEVASKVRQVSRAHVTAIGVHVSALPAESLASSGLDSVVRGEPEVTLCELADALSAKADLSCVAGLSFRAAERIVHNEDRRPVEDLDALPLPARDLIDNSRYCAPLSAVPQTLIMSSRGCSHGCVYCTASCYYGTRVRRRSAASVVAEMRECVERHGVSDFLMWADTFTSDRRHVFELCEAIVRSGLDVRWMCNSRVDAIDAEMLRAMKEAGCWAVAYGVESGSQSILDSSGKRTTLDQASNAIDLTRRAGLTSMAHVMVGLPGETQASVAETSRFLAQLDPDYVQVYCAVPFPGSRLYESEHRRGNLGDLRWSDFDQAKASLHTGSMTPAQVSAARRSVLAAFYLRPRYLLRRLLSVSGPLELAGLVKGGIGFVGSWMNV